MLKKLRAKSIFKALNFVKPHKYFYAHRHVIVNENAREKKVYVVNKEWENIIPSYQLILLYFFSRTHLESQIDLWEQLKSIRLSIRVVIDSLVLKMDKEEREKEIVDENKRWYQQITVEPTMFLYMMAFMVTAVAENVYFNYKSCVANHGLPHEICIKIEEYEDIKKEVQKTTTKFLQNNSIAGHVIPIILALFMGSFSDRRGR